MGLLSDRTVLRQQDGGAPPRQVRICFSLTNTPALCYLYCIETVSLLTEPCGAPQCRDGGRVNADRLGSLAQLLRKAAFFVVGSCFYKQGALNGGIFCPQTRRFFAAILTDCKGKQRSMRAKKTVSGGVQCLGKRLLKLRLRRTRAACCRRAEAPAPPGPHARSGGPSRPRAPRCGLPA